MIKSWKNSNVFVTGCNGLLGSWLVKYLLDNGANVIGLLRDELPNSNLDQLGLCEKITSVRGDLQDYSLLRRIMSEYEVGFVFHLAAQTLVTVANTDPRSTFETNIRGTWNILEVARQTKSLKGIIVASSDKAYGEKCKLPYHETDSLEGSHPYDVSKSCADLIAQSYYKTYKVPVCVTRCANLYGGGDLNFSRIIPGTIRSAFYNERPIIRSDGKFLRDYFYVEDAVLAMLNLAEYMKNKLVLGEAFNFSSGVHLNVVDLVERILRLMGKKIKSVVLNKAHNEIRDQYLSIKKANNLLKWHPCFDIHVGLKRTIEWYMTYFVTREGR